MLLINIYKVVANVDFMKLKNNRLLLIITKMFFFQPYYGWNELKQL